MGFGIASYKKLSGQVESRKRNMDLSSGLSKWHYWLIKKINKMSLLGFEKNGRNKATWKSRCFAFLLSANFSKLLDIQSIKLIENKKNNYLQQLHLLLFGLNLF
jgi:hypothetical protein